MCTEPVAVPAESSFPAIEYVAVSFCRVVLVRPPDRAYANVLSALSWIHRPVSTLIDNEIVRVGVQVIVAPIFALVSLLPPTSRGTLLQIGPASNEIGFPSSEVPA